MTSNSQVIIQGIRTDLEKMLEYVTGEQARTATADATERGLFRMLIEMGLKLLTLFFVMRSQNARRETLKMVDGNELYYHRDTERRYVSIFGKLRFARPYFYQKGKDGKSPLDAELSLGEDCYSDLVWPDNIRELRNTAERIVLLEKGDTLLGKHLSFLSGKEEPLETAGRFQPFIPPQGIVLDKVEKEYILEALGMKKGNKSEAAKILGISRSALLYRMEKHKIKWDGGFRSSPEIKASSRRRKGKKMAQPSSEFSRFCRSVFY